MYGIIHLDSMFRNSFAIPQCLKQFPYEIQLGFGDDAYSYFVITYFSPLRPDSQ